MHQTIHALLKRSVLSFTLVVLALGMAACAPPVLNSPGGKGSSGPSIPLPLPPIPGGGGAGEPGAPSLPQLPKSKSGQSGDGKSDKSGSKGPDSSGSGEKSAQNGDAADDKKAATSEESNGEEQGASNSPPEGWVDEEEASDSDTKDDCALDSANKAACAKESPSFEETASTPSVEEPSFEDTDAMSEEELEALEKELEETLGDFDDEIDREKRFAEERANENTSDGLFGDEGDFEDYNEDDNGNATSKKSSNKQAKSEGSPDGDAAGNQSGSGGGGAGAKGTKTTRKGDPDSPTNEQSNDDGLDVPDLRKNDDIVARQIREAAESETDPELKKKLWEEYYRYKGL